MLCGPIQFEHPDEPIAAFVTLADGIFHAPLDRADLGLRKSRHVKPMHDHYSRFGPILPFGRPYGEWEGTRCGPFLNIFQDRTDRYGALDGLIACCLRKVACHPLASSSVFLNVSKEIMFTADRNTATTS